MYDLVHDTEAVRRQYPGFVAGLVLLYPTCAGLVALRFWVRHKYTKNLAWDDLCLLVALVMIIIAGIVWLPILGTLTRANGEFPHGDNHLFTQYLVASSFYVGGGIFVKLAICGFFFPVARKTWQRLVLIIPMIIYILAIITSFSVYTLRCGAGASGKRILTAGNCELGTSSFAPVTTSSAVMNVICDLAFSLIPVHMLVTGDRLDKKTRTSSCFIIALALAACVISIVRVPFFAQTTLGPDFLYHMGPLSFLSILEVCVAIDSISLVTLKPLLLKAFPTRTARNTAKSIDGANPPSKKDWFWAATERVGISRQKSRGRLGVLPDTTINQTMMMMTVDQEAGRYSGPFSGSSFLAPPAGAKFLALPGMISTVHEKDVFDV